MDIPRAACWLLWFIVECPLRVVLSEGDDGQAVIEVRKIAQISNLRRCVFGDADILLRLGQCFDDASTDT